MKNDRKLADEIERYLGPDATYHHWDPSLEDMEQIIAALRRVPEPVPEGFVRAVPDPLGRTMCTAQATGQWPFNERPPSGEMVMVPREPTHKMILAGHSALTDTHANWQQQIDNAYRAMLAAAEASKEAK